ncbi:MAG: UDP-4-amino-4,6-dideoxy-N-acetyl-beta-L-altrosamine transaminase [Pseudomonadota bacterium]
MTDAFLPYGRQSIDEQDIAAVTNVLRSDYLTTGPAVTKFEEDIARFTGGHHVIACANGTGALHMVSMMEGLDENFSVIVPDITFLATANGPRMNGANVIFCDVDGDTGLITPALLEACIDAHRDKNLRAVFVVHLAGQPCDMPAIARIARANNLLVIEDACHALGARYQDDAGRDYRVGACDHSDMATFSFHPVKNVTTGEGGAITCISEERAASLRAIRSHNMTRHPQEWQNQDLAFDANGNPNPWYYEAQAPGLNYRMCDIQAALGISQLQKLPEFLEKRHQLAGIYNGALENLPHLQPVPQRKGTWSGMHLYVVLIDFEAIGKDRAQVMQELRQSNIGSQVHYIPVSCQPCYHDIANPEARPGAQSWYRRCLSLPLFPAMTSKDVLRVVDSLRRITET